MHKASKVTIIKAPCFLIAVAAVDHKARHTVGIRQTANLDLEELRAWKLGSALEKKKVERRAKE